MANYGTLTVADLVASRFATIKELGEENVFGAIQASLDAHNRVVSDMLGDLCEITKERIGTYGALQQGEMVDLDEMGAPDVQKVSAGIQVGWPMRKNGYAIQWTRTYMEIKTGAELAAQFDAAREADVRRIRRDIARAFFNPTNNLTYKDRLVDGMVLPIRAFLNADSTAVPIGPNGEQYDASTHTHYLGTGSLTAANISALIETVLEHNPNARLVLYINRAQEAAVRGFTSNFTAYTDPRIIQGSGVTRANGSLDMGQLANRAIGIFDAAEVWVKPWIPANYMAVVDLSVSEKPLRIRTRTGSMEGPGALSIAADHEHYPLRAQTMDREYGIAPWNRASAAMLYTANATYTAPTIS